MIDRRPLTLEDMAAEFEMGSDWIDIVSGAAALFIDMELS
jgi:hypothetical protein